MRLSKASGLKELPHEDLVLGAGLALLAGDEALGVKIAEGIVHGDHADVFAGLHDAVEHEGLAVPDARGDGGRVDQEFQGHGTAVAVGLGNELLGDDATKGFGHHDADLVPLVRRKDVKNTVEGSGGVSGVECSQHQVSGFGGGDGQWL